MPTFADKSVKPAACRADIDLVVLINGKTTALARNADFNVISVFAELVENTLGQNPCCTVKVNLDINEL